MIKSVRNSKQGWQTWETEIGDMGDSYERHGIERWV